MNISTFEQCVNKRRHDTLILILTRIQIRLKIITITWRVYHAHTIVIRSNTCVRIFTLKIPQVVNIYCC